jgi:deoxyadenosine/deoxycytidine kinase
MGLVVIVEGLIGAGKSTLTHELGEALGPNTLTLMEPDEKDAANPYLSDFYGDKSRWSFTMQVHLLGARYKMQLAAQWHAMSNRGHACLDRSFYGDTCFARMMNRTGEISDREFETYRVIYQTMTASVLLPSACVRLRVDPKIAAERIQMRASEREGRRSELTIDLGYLEALEREIDITTEVLRQQGVQILEIPWSENRGSPEERSEAVREIADRIHRVEEPDLFLQHHRRVLR